MTSENSRKSALVIPVDHHGVAVKRRRAALAVAVPALHVAEVVFPEQLAVQVETEEASRTERDDQHLAIGGARRWTFWT